MWYLNAFDLVQSISIHFNPFHLSTLGPICPNWTSRQWIEKQFLLVPANLLCCTVPFHSIIAVSTSLSLIVWSEIVGSGGFENRIPPRTSQDPLWTRKMVNIVPVVPSFSSNCEDWRTSQKMDWSMGCSDVQWMNLAWFPIFWGFLGPAEVGAAGGSPLCASSHWGPCHRGHVCRGQGRLQLPSALGCSGSHLGMGENCSFNLRGVYTAKKNYDNYDSLWNLYLWN